MEKNPKTKFMLSNVFTASVSCVMRNTLMELITQTHTNHSEKVYCHTSIYTNPTKGASRQRETRVSERLMRKHSK